MNYISNLIFIGDIGSYFSNLLNNPIPIVIGAIILVVLTLIIVLITTPKKKKGNEFTNNNLNYNQNDEFINYNQNTNNLQNVSNMEQVYGMNDNITNPEPLASNNNINMDMGINNDIVSNINNDNSVNDTLNNLGSQDKVNNQINNTQLNNINATKSSNLQVPVEENVSSVNSDLIPNSNSNEMNNQVNNIDNSTSNRVNNIEPIIDNSTDLTEVNNNINSISEGQSISNIPETINVSPILDSSVNNNIAVSGISNINNINNEESVISNNPNNLNTINPSMPSNDSFPETNTGILNQPIMDNTTSTTELTNLNDPFKTNIGENTSINNIAVSGISNISDINGEGPVINANPNELNNINPSMPSNDSFNETNTGILDQPIIDNTTSTTEPTNLSNSINANLPENNQIANSTVSGMSNISNFNTNNENLGELKNINIDPNSIAVPEKIDFSIKLEDSLQDNLESTEIKLDNIEIEPVINTSIINDNPSEIEPSNSITSDNEVANSLNERLNGAFERELGIDNENRENISFNNMFEATQKINIDDIKSQADSKEE